MMTREPVSPPRSRPASLVEVPASRRPESSRAAPLSNPAASYPVVTSCRRNSVPVAVAPDSKPATTRPILPSEITIAAGVPLPLSAGRIFKKVAGVGAMALLAGILVVAFTRRPSGVDGGPLSSNVSNVPKTIVTDASSNPSRAVRGKIGAGSGAVENGGEIGANDAPHASDTVAMAALGASTSASSGSNGSPMRTALLTTSTTSKSKLGSSSPMKQAKYVQPARNAKSKKTVVAVKHSTAKAAPWHGAKARPAATTAKAKASH